METTEGSGLLQKIFHLRGRHLSRSGRRIVCRLVDATVDAIVVAPLGQFEVELTQARLDGFS